MGCSGQFLHFRGIFRDRANLEGDGAEDARQRTLQWRNSASWPGLGEWGFGAGTSKDIVPWGTRPKVRLTGLRLAAQFRISWIMKAKKVAYVDAAMIPEDDSKRETPATVSLAGCGRISITG
jgi:hypothetical protein